MKILDTACSVRMQQQNHCPQNLDFQKFSAIWYFFNQIPPSNSHHPQIVATQSEALSEVNATLAIVANTWLVYKAECACIPTIASDDHLAIALHVLQLVFIY